MDPTIPSDNPETQTNRIYFMIIIGASLILIIMVALFFMLRNRSTEPQSTTPAGSQQTPAPQETTPVISITPTDTPIPTPVDFTGVKEVEFTEEEEAQINQERVLRRLSPYNGETFTVTYNVTNDTFEVSLSEPADQAENNFNSWREKEYPGVPAERFIIQN